MQYKGKIISQKFHIGDVLSITTGKLVSTRHMDGIYDILKFMTGRSVFTHEIPDFIRECQKFLLEQFPQLTHANADQVDENSLESWIKEQEKTYGKELDIKPLP
ncbi:hypothetical protein [Clostridium formicaceticum]|uniref:DUF7736 domain-containing protein n=1 Tax=Clostridium formicaceticum TaxID=1497 RepID=A0AAC9RN79_9CLOT|nr:hypothetical protein [Clostridium formicaceticum]AOY74740.1 hypothetical protein BJL90_01480 [Clostridium formicaceticum]ARE89126.1 hypothetical protein CLFO_35320 [Clostridium formicaceticum]